LKQRIKLGDIEVDLESEEIFQNGIPLFPGEVQKKILLSLVRNYPNPVTKEELLMLLEKPSDLALRVNISKLKKSFHLNIKSIRGVGYQII